MSGFRRFSRNLLHHHNLPHHLENHAPGLKKWWKAYERTNGQIVEHISPYQQKIISPLFKDPIHKATVFLGNHWTFFPPALLAYFIMKWNDEKYEEYERAEWP